ncbi:MAG: TSUP family transporter [Oligoflexia bacterium]|nr:TSUP family transporter [Oligoflexia bacterium]
MLDDICLMLIAFAAGFIDASAGGGGIIQVPGIMLFAPALTIPEVFATNKFASVWGTSIACLKFIKEKKVPWNLIVWGIPFALIASFFGANCVSSFDKNLIRPFVITLLIFVIIYSIFAKKFIKQHQSKINNKNILIALVIIFSSVIGFYDGIFGPGTGSFLIFLFVTFLGCLFLEANAGAKVINLLTNIGAIIYFLLYGNIHFILGIKLAIFNMFGGYLGAKIAIKYGNQYVRLMFIIISSALIIKLIIDSI